ncbi:MAG: sigma-70 family RNA polymerase sigma factor [Heliobacteriaceae bacterium]|jgi:RNA polymerase sigma-B factor|nr:sigma-70 family RNA polymerase sigma factor [Heliobacteriaceae bacterium]
MGEIKPENLEILLIAYKECSDEKKKRMIHLNIVDSAMQLVKKIAGPISAQSGIPGEDLIQVGSIGLIKAIDFFDAAKNTRFKTYATYFIKGEIKHYLRDKASIIKAPRKSQKTEEIDYYKNVISLDQKIFYDEDETTLADKIPAGDYREFLNSYEDKITIAGAIEKLPAEFRQIIELSYYKDLNQREISEKLNISQMQVSRRLKKALNKMYEIIEGERL